jgi:hypothetical protein
MTASERFEQQLPELMAELAPARVPDYFDDMLRQSARTRQRPAWSVLERWLPMGVIARTSTVRQVPWRPIVVAALLSGQRAVAVRRLPRVPTSLRAGDRQWIRPSAMARSSLSTSKPADQARFAARRRDRASRRTAARYVRQDHRRATALGRQRWQRRPVPD